MNLELLQISEQALKASPFNAYAYGLLVAVLIAAVAALWLRLVKEQAERAVLLQKVTELMTKMLFTHEEDKGLRTDIKEFIFEVKAFFKDYASKETALEDKLNKILDHIKE
jgi:hypothetical protein